jgi:anti-anti-sigma factor
MHASETAAAGRGHRWRPATELARDAGRLLRVAVTESRPGVVVVLPTGEVDAATADLLGSVLQEAVAAVPRCVVVDLTGVTFCGSAGLVVLLDARRWAEAVGTAYATVGGGRIVRRVLEITRLGPALGHRETLDDALRDVVAE